MKRMKEMIGTFAGIITGAIAGFKACAHIGIAGPFGAVAGGIPGAIIGGIIGGLTGNKAGTEMDRRE